MNWSPITKVVAAFVASGILYVARRIGLDLGPAAVNEAVVAGIGIVVAYLTPDRRVAGSTGRRP